MPTTTGGNRKRGKNNGSSRASTTIPESQPPRSSSSQSVVAVASTVAPSSFVESVKDGQHLKHRASQGSLDDAQPTWKVKRLHRGAVPIRTLIVLAIISIVFGTLGGLILYGHNSATECIVAYEDPGKACANPVECTNAFIVIIDERHCTNLYNRTLNAPVYLFYQLENYYQNIRRYWRSRSNLQLRNNRILQPCGTLARSVFNDSFGILYPAGITMDESADAITWSVDRKGGMFKNPVLEEADKDYIDDWLSEDVFPGKIENPHFIVWMRTATLPTFRKLYGVINTTVRLPVHILVESRYPVRGFDGRKSVVLATHQFLGPQSRFLGIAYVVTAAICFLFAFFLFF